MNFIPRKEQRSRTCAPCGKSSEEILQRRILPRPTPVPRFDDKQETKTRNVIRVRQLLRASQRRDCDVRVLRDNGVQHMRFAAQHPDKLDAIMRERMDYIMILRGKLSLPRRDGPPSPILCGKERNAAPFRISESRLS